MNAILKCKYPGNWEAYNEANELIVFGEFAYCIKVLSELGYTDYTLH